MGARILTLVAHLGLTHALQDNMMGLQERHPYTEEDLHQIRELMAADSGCPTQLAHDVEQGQPFALHLLHHMTGYIGDPDSAFPIEARTGVPLGVDEPIAPAHGVWPYKDAWIDEGISTDVPEEPHAEDNYPSAEEFGEDIVKTYEEDAAEGLVYGPHTEREAANICGCRPHELCYVPLAGKQEGTKVRTVNDGTATRAAVHGARL